MEGSDWIGTNCMVGSTIVGCSVSLSEEIALNSCIVRSKPFPIDLIQVIGLENERTDGSGSWT